MAEKPALRSFKMTLWGNKPNKREVAAYFSKNSTTGPAVSSLLFKDPVLPEPLSALKPSLVSAAALLAPARSCNHSKQIRVPGSRVPVTNKSRIRMGFEKWELSQ